jgi:hypothetical protein
MINPLALGSSLSDLEETIEIRRTVEIPPDYEKYYKNGTFANYVNQSDRSIDMKELQVTMIEKPKLMIFPSPESIREKQQQPLRIVNDYQFMSFPPLYLTYLVLLEPDTLGNPDISSPGIPIPRPDFPHEDININPLTNTQYTKNWFDVRPINMSERVLKYTDVIIRTTKQTDNQLTVERIDIVGETQQVSIRDINTSVK